MLRLIFVLCFTCRALRLSEAPEKAKLVFDVGMNRGDDTKDYLDQGYNVVSIEANPVWAKKGGQLFKQQIKQGRLTIKNMAISEVHDEPITFYVVRYKPGVLSMVKWLDALGYLKKDGAEHMQHAAQFGGSKLLNESTGLLTMLEHIDEMSSMSKESCLNSGCGPQEEASCECQEVRVKSTTCAELINQHGTPHYLKVDIEGFDGYCMRNIATLPCSKMPLFISFEEQSIHNITRAVVAPSEELIKTLSARGYQWKVSRQSTETHGKAGTGPFGEDVEDRVHGKKWSVGTEAVKQANLDCWNLSIPNVKESFQFDCDVHGKFFANKCKEPKK